MNYQVDEQPMLALRRARRAWERSQPQLTLDWDGLESGEVKRAAGETSPSSPVAAAASPVSSPCKQPNEPRGASWQTGSPEHS